MWGGDKEGLAFDAHFMVSSCYFEFFIQQIANIQYFFLFFVSLLFNEDDGGWGMDEMEYTLSIATFFFKLTAVINYFGVVCMIYCIYFQFLKKLFLKSYCKSIFKTVFA